MSAFRPPDHIVYHEVGHALMGYSLRLGIKVVNVELFYHSGRVDYVSKVPTDEAWHMLSIAGPVAQQMFMPASTMDKRLQGLLFDKAFAADFRYWSNMETAVSDGRCGWKG